MRSGSRPSRTDRPQDKRRIHPPGKPAPTTTIRRRRVGSLAVWGQTYEITCYKRLRCGQGSAKCQAECAGRDENRRIGSRSRPCAVRSPTRSGRSRPSAASPWFPWQLTSGVGSAGDPGPSPIDVPKLRELRSALPTVLRWTDHLTAVPTASASSREPRNQEIRSYDFRQ